jgi:TolA-binding protein
MSKFKSLKSRLILGSWCVILLLCFIFNPSLVCSQESKEEESLFVARKAFEDGFYEVSLGLLEKFQKTFPNSDKKAEVGLLVGQCYFYQNKYLDALKKFEELLAQPSSRPIHDAVYYWIAEVHFKGNNFSKAAEFYKKIIDGYPKSPYFPAAYYSTGWCFLQQGRYAEALKYFRAVEEKFPKDPLARESAYKAIECLYNNKDYLQMKDDLKGYFKNYPKDLSRIPYLYFYAAEAEYYLNNFSEAVKEYSKVISSTKDEKMLALSKLGIGWSYLKEKRYKNAEEVFAEIKEESLEKPALGTLLLGEAIIAGEDKKFREAEKIYDRILGATADPSVLIQAYLGKADILYNLNDYDRAVSVYNLALENVSEAVSRELVDKIHYGLAWAYLKGGHFKEAIDEFQKVARQSEEKTVKVSALCQIGDAYQEAGNYPKAIEAYDSILKDYPDNFYGDYVQYQLGVTLLKTGKYDGAIMAFQKLKAEYPGSKLLDDASYALGLSYFQRENYMAAKENFEKFQNEYRESNLRPQAIYLLGSSLYNLGKFPEAIEVYKDIIRTCGDDSELVQKSEYEIADCYYQMGNEKEAMNRFKLLRTKYPDSRLTPEVIWWLGEYYYRRNDPKLARRYFSSLIQDFPKSNLIPNTYYALASTYQEEDDYAGALENFKKVVALGKSDLAAQAGIAIADIYARQGKNDLAMTEYMKVSGEYANLGDLLFPKIAEIYRNTGKFDDALEYYRKSLDLVSAREMGDVQFMIAETLQAQGKRSDAVAEYLKVTYLYSEDSKLAVKALLRVAAIYEDNEEYKEALNIYRRITGMNVEEAKYAQERIDWIRGRVK